MQAPADARAPAPPPDPRNQRKLAQGSWTLYDFANTIFSYAIVSTAIGLWLTDDDAVRARASGSSSRASPSRSASASTPSCRRSWAR